MRTRLAVLLTVTALILAACGNAGDDDDSATDDGVTSAPATSTSDDDLDTNIPSTEPGVTDEEIQVVVISSKTNPLNGKYAEIADGIQAYFDMVNSEGGIYGRELVITKERDDVVGLQNQQEVQASLAEDNAFATFIASLGGGGFQLLDDAGMPTFIWNIRPEMAGHENIFGHLGALCIEEGCEGQVTPWLAEQIGAEQVGVLGYGVAAESKQCAALQRGGFEKYDTAEVVFFDDTLQFGQADLSAQVAQMKDKGVDFVTTCMDLNETLILAKEMRKQGLQAVQQLPNGYDREFIAANAEFYEGSYVIPQYTGLEHEPQLPEVQTFLEWLDKSGKGFVELTAVGWILAYQFVEGLDLAGPEFTQQKVIDALNTVTDMRVNGMIAPLDWTQQHQDPIEHPESQSELECANFVKIVGGEFESAFAEPGKPWVCFENNAETLSEPQNVSFEPEE